MARKTKQDWMQCAIELLVEYGIDGITIDTLTRKMEVTKGSFYHHFGDMATFRAEMLAMCLHQSSTSVIERAEAGATPYEKLMLLTHMAALIDPSEVAIRVWALRDPDAHDTLIEIDARRLDYVTSIYRQLGLDDAAAALASRLFYCVFIGGHHLLPPVTTPQMYEMFTALRQLAGVQSE
ncbi:MAG: TetR/AcrR family transcriptional regulator [Chloroflexota bacterium]|nr:TetR/AcrR family transcriptional regulator [Chloroflexota bacterium]